MRLLSVPNLLRARRASDRARLHALEALARESLLLLHAQTIALADLDDRLATVQGKLEREE